MPEQTPHLSTQDFVINDGKLIGDWEGLYSAVDDPWGQSSIENRLGARKQIAINRIAQLNSKYVGLKVLELGCGFGFMTDKLREMGIESLGTDISPTAIEKARKLHPSSRFDVSDYNNFELFNLFNPDVVIMSELTWYILDTIDKYILDLKNYSATRSKPTFLVHLLATYKQGVQKYGSHKFTNYEEILKYFNLKYLESGFIAESKTNDPDSQGTYFIAKVKN
jgi:SAM-dependent methyltransferase